MTFRNLRLALAPVTVVAGGLLLVSNASASLMGTLLTGSSGTVTVSLNSAIFNNDPAATGGGNSDVSSGTNLTFAGCASGVLGSPGCLSTQEGVTVNNADLTLSAPTVANADTFLTFAAHANLVFSINWPPGPGSANTDCSTASSNGLSCSVFAGSPIVLTYDNGNTFVGLGVAGKASDAGTGGLAAGSNYTGGFSEFFTNPIMVGGVLVSPTPHNVQLYFCPTGVCQPADFSSGRSITSSQSGTFTATPVSGVPEPSPLWLGSVGIVMLLAGRQLRKVSRTRS